MLMGATVEPQENDRFVVGGGRGSVLGAQRGASCRIEQRAERSADGDLQRTTPCHNRKWGVVSRLGDLMSIHGVLRQGVLRRVVGAQLSRFGIQSIAGGPKRNWQSEMVPSRQGRR